MAQEIFPTVNSYNQPVFLQDTRLISQLLRWVELYNNYKRNHSSMINVNLCDCLVNGIFVNMRSVRIMGSRLGLSDTRSPRDLSCFAVSYDVDFTGGLTSSRQRFCRKYVNMTFVSTTADRVRPWRNVRHRCLRRRFTLPDEKAALVLAFTIWTTPGYAVDT